MNGYFCWLMGRIASQGRRFDGVATIVSSSRSVVTVRKPSVFEAAVCLSLGLAE